MQYQKLNHTYMIMSQRKLTNRIISSAAANNNNNNNNNIGSSSSSMSISSSSSLLMPDDQKTSIPIPGTYGWWVVGPLRDRLDYFWFQGAESFFKKRMDKYKSSVYRTNVPPCFPLFAGVNPNVIAVLDCESFSHLFDMDIIEKKNILIGDFMPSLTYTGNLRVCAYLDTAEHTHAQVKSFVLDILKRSSTIWVSSWLSSLDTMWSAMDESLSTKGKASYLIPLQKSIFSFLTKSIVGADPASSPHIAESGYRMLDEWIALQILPTVEAGKFLQPLEEILLHSFAYPFWFVKRGYNKLVDFIAKEGEEVLQRGQNQFGLSRDETIHNLLFVLGFNAFGGFSVFLPTLLSHLGKDTTGVQKNLREEVRSKMAATNSTVLSFELIKQMPLVQSYVYETLRLNPPVPIQYGRARKDFLLSSHDSAFDVKKGELLCGYQPLVMRDPKVFDDPETFVPDRFVGEKGQELLNHLYWSNGPQTGSPSPSNKQCPAKDFVAPTACLFVADLFQRYDFITCNSTGHITAAVKAGTIN
ncbi:hypothetical protein Dimus_019708 [Dionaea muscipula]